MFLRKSGPHRNKRSISGEAGAYGHKEGPSADDEGKKWSMIATDEKVMGLRKGYIAKGLAVEEQQYLHVHGTQTPGNGEPVAVLFQVLPRLQS